MSLSYDFEKSIILGLIATTLTLIVGLIILLNPFAHGQTLDNGQTAKQKVNKLIQDTIKNQTFDKEYHTELIKRLQNTTCLTEASERMKQDGYPNFNPEFFTTQKLENTLIQCVSEGKIKWIIKIS